MEKVEVQTVETTYIPTKKEAEIKIKALCLKLLLCPESFTLLELATLQKHMENEAYLG